jgi:hypothetical protein
LSQPRTQDGQRPPQLKRPLAEGKPGRLSSRRVESPPIGDRAERLVRSWWLTAALLALAVAALYGRSLNFGFVSDDWPLLEQAAQGFGVVFAIGGGYHYNPIPTALVVLLHAAFGIWVLPYHLVALALFWTGAVLVAMIARRLTKQPLVAALAGLLFVCYGTQYEAAIWGAVAFWHTTSTILFLGGLLCYLLATDGQLAHRQRFAAYVGFAVAVFLSPFAHEQTLSLIVICGLYRLFVLEHARGFGARELAARLRDWLRDFAVPGALIVGYLGFKLWIGSRTPTPQAPGLQAPWNALTFTATIGFFQAFIPGIGLHTLLRLTLVAFHPYLHLVVLLLQATAIAKFVLVTNPTRRFLALWTVTMVVAMTLGLANISSRHLYLITAPAAILWSDLIGSLIPLAPRLLSRLGLRKQQAHALRFFPALIASVTLILAGGGYATVMQSAWGASSGHTRSLLDQVGRLAQGIPAPKAVYLVDLPDYVDAPTGESLYMFRNAPQPAVRLTFPGLFTNVVALRTRDDFPIARGYTILASADQLAQYAGQPDALVLRYDGPTGALVRWQEPVRMSGPLVTGDIPSEIPVGELVQGLQVTQTFLSTCPNLAEIDLYLATYARPNTHPLLVRVQEVGSGQVLLDQSIAGSAVRDNAWHEFPLAPVPDSAGKTYMITLSSPEGQPGNAISIWSSRTDAYPGGEANVNGIAINADLVFRYRCQK